MADRAALARLPNGLAVHLVSRHDVEPPIANDDDVALLARWHSDDHRDPEAAHFRGRSERDERIGP